MEQKIRQYVEYQFRFDNRDDIEDLKEEIIANLIDRYQQYIKAGKDENSAYIEAIKSMGDFTNDNRNIIPEEYSMKPSIPDILLMSGAILSIFGLIITLLSGVAGTIITALSIILFSGSSYYLYSYSQYVKKEYMDIKKHNLLLIKIFKYMKTSFVFWAISLSLTLATIVTDIISYIFLLGATTDTIDNVMNGSIISSLNDFKSLIILNIVIFIILLIVLLQIFRNIYERLMDYYYNLTGDKDLNGKINDSYKFLYGNNEKKVKNPKVLSNEFIPVLGIVFCLPYFFLNVTIISDNHYGYSYDYVNLIIFLMQMIFKWKDIIFLIPLISLLLTFVLIILFLNKKIKRKWLLLVAYYICFIIMAMLDILTAPALILYDHSEIYFDSVYTYSFWMIIILTIILIYRKITLIRFKNKEV